MRQFIVVGHEVTPDVEISLDDLPGAGRFDVLCRSVTAGLLTSHGIRTDALVHLVIDDAVTITVDGASVRRLNPDERSTAALLRGALEEREEAIGHQPVESSPGVELRRRGLEATLDAVAASGDLIVLDEDGDPAPSVQPPEDPVFVLSDHHDFTEDERTVLAQHDATPISLGPQALHGDQAITVAHNWLDTGGFERY
ncbi:tRNA (pseudouridine(54)-N(1))-methyltransferase TrmY [Salinarchaeum laminariae]|uniref:tRNA (pseudouridine(54)-N(1))-methyltransferase TrmY n=1 Tax=Salinarchaeum laminariae TaxID=869888 RepID=UPI0020BE0C8B|nr:tRNA (pseudouridine(54)-N(1))-methyltransferase TrmY [Salinarchaeum laminariae]